MSSSCITVRFVRTRAFEPIPDEVLDGLRAGRDDLTRCLAALGAPNLVFEQPGDGVALAYAWLDQFVWGIDASLSLRGFAVSADLGRDVRKMHGVVLFFDRELQLVEVERGLLRDFLLARGRRRPASIEPSDDSQRR
ncbi:MAG: hypothetical protein R3F56_22330 [Planctomycetota bacterium]